MIELVLVDDQTDFRSALRDLLAGSPDVRIIGEAANGRDAVTAVLDLRPSLTLMDIRMPVCDGITATREICARAPEACVLMLTTFDDDQLIREAMLAGAAGYMLKGMPLEDMLSIFRLALRGYTTINRRKSPASDQLRAHDPEPRLSDREREIWALLGAGFTNRQIAERLFITEGTVKNYVSNVLTALGLRHRTEAALMWRTHYMP